MKSRMPLWIRELFAVSFVIVGALPGGCATGLGGGAPAAAPVVNARYASMPVTVDGMLLEEVWSNAPAYQLALGRDRLSWGHALAERGQVRFAWDDKYLYVAVEFVDSDIVAEGTEDQLQHVELGDVAELFVKPADRTWYWELYVTPAGRKSSFWYPGRGRQGLPSGFQYHCGLQVAARSDGTLNAWEDRDRCWIAELAMPIADLTARGETFGAGARWHVLVGRYNYSRELPHKELSMHPQLPRTDYHDHDGYAVLELAK